MKAYSNYIKQTKYWVALLAMNIFLFSCTDSDIIEKEGTEAGIPTSVKISFTNPSMNVVSRALSDAEESKINDLCILVFDAGTGERKKIDYFSGAEINYNAQKGSVTLNTTSGSSYIFGVANVKINQMKSGDHKNLYELLETEATNMDNFNALTASLNQDGNISRTVASLVMSGSYTNGNDHGKTLEAVQIDSKTTSLPGSIHLRRLDSRIKFVIKTGSNIKTFQPVSWRVFNVPSSASIFEQENDATGVEYHSSAEDIHFNNETSGQSEFEFYMLENRKKSQGDITKYTERELEEKAVDDGSNTGKYIHVEDNATFVEIKAKIEIALGNGGTRLADVKYTVHLGYCEGNSEAEKAKDFNCRRNTKYLYTVTINGVDNIILEATKEGEEPEPGAEGNVVDSDTKIITLDAHYATFNIEMTPDERKDLKYKITTPFTSIDSDNIGNEKDSEDYQWIEFRKTEKGKLAEYAYSDTKPRPEYAGERRLFLEDLKADESEGNYYTVFINENFYKNRDWQEFVNTDNRQILLIFSPQYSSDKESSYAKAKYLITQRSIQTYFNTDPTKPISDSAIGIEHINETSKNLNWTISGGNRDANNGWDNVWKYIQYNIQWSNYAQLTVPDDNMKTFTMNTTQDRPRYKYDEAGGYYEILSACLSRNRDENGNGVIDEDELKWYLPAINQYLDIYLGAESLVTPLFDASSIPAGNNMAARNEYHYAASDYQKIFSEQGCSTNFVSWSNNTTPKWAQEIRCIRNLGTPTDNNNVYEYNNHIFNMTYLNDRSIRKAPIMTSNTWLSSHKNFDYEVNAPYKSFEVAESDCSIDWKNGGYNQSWSIFVEEGTACKNYYQEKNGSDKGTWRAPNQRELMLMFIEKNNLDLPHVNIGSCTGWKYDNKRYCGINNYSGVYYVSSGQEAYAFTWRCVRDRE